MSNKTILQNCNNRLNTNNTDLDTILSKINNLPEAGETAEDLSTELTEQDNLITDQETTIEDVMLVLQNKAAGSSEVNLQEKIVAPTTSSQSIIADSGYTGLSKVTVSAVTSSIDSNITATNIRSGVSILGVNGTLEEGITPTGTIEINQNGTHDVTNYASAKVNVESISDTTYEDGLITRSITGDYVNNRITTIGNNSLRTLPITSLHCENVTSVAGEAVRQCNYLVDVYLPNCTQTGGYSFGICPLLERVELGAMTNIKAYDFYNCPKLTTFIINNTATVCSLANVSAFTSSGIASGTGYIYVPDDLVDSYKAATNWSTYADQIKGLSELEV